MPTSAKAVPSGFYTALTHAQIKSVALQGIPPHECIQLVNEALVRNKASSILATCFYGILNLSTTGEVIPLHPS